MSEQHTNSSPALTLETATEMVNQLRQSINASVVGQQQVVDQVIISLLCNGHVLVEGVPGLAKIGPLRV